MKLKRHKYNCKNGGINQMNNLKVNIEAYEVFSKKYNEFAEKLEQLGADDSIFLDLRELCASSANIYK